MATQHAKEVDEAIHSLDQIKAESPQHASVLDKLAEYIRKDPHVIKMESNFFNMSSRRPINEVLGPVLTWALAGTMVISAGAFAAFPVTKLISTLQKVSLHSRFHPAFRTPPTEIESDLCNVSLKCDHFSMPFKSTVLRAERYICAPAPAPAPAFGKLLTVNSKQP
jgi:hypothetical protein